MNIKPPHFCVVLKQYSDHIYIYTFNRNSLQNERNDDMLWDHLYDKAVSLADDIGVEATVPRCHGRQANRPNAPAQTPSQFWRVNMYLPFVDHLIVELTNRLLNPHGRFTAQYLLPTKVQISLSLILSYIYILYD